MWDYVLTTTGDILLISEELPKFDPLQGAGSKAYVPVQNPDKLVFTGATVGGITTGGFHTQSGGISYETISLGYHQHVRFKAGKFGEKPIDFSFLPLRLDIYSSNKLPERFKNKASNQGRDYYVDSIPDRIKKENRDYSEALFFDYVQIEDEEFNELIFGAQSDEQLYNKAIQLASKGSKEALTEAAKMFAQLGDYKDSLFKSNDCLQKASHAINESGCYVATAVYGSYDCPQVWTLRRYRDYTLAETWYGRAFVRTYYVISPTLVKWFGETQWFKNMWKPKLDRMVKKLNEKGVADTPYQDRNW